MNHISIFAKITHRCNLRCSYCYDAQTMEQKGDMDINQLKKMILMASKYYKSITVFFHGGEPLIMGADYFKEILHFCNSIKGVNFDFDVQSNGTLVNQEFIDIYNILGMGFSFSYDGLSTDLYRCPKEKIIDKIKVVQKSGQNVGLVVVANDGFLDHVIDEYEHIKSLKVKDMKVNNIFGDTLTSDYAKKYVDKMIELFNYWKYDQDAVPIEQFEAFLKMSRGQRASMCNLNCHKHWIGLNSDGTIGMCDFGAFPKEINFGHIDDYGDFCDMYYGDKRMNVMKQIADRFKNCFNSECELTGKCTGGCNAHLYREFGDFSSVGGVNCKIKVDLYKGINKNVDISDTLQYNKIIQRILKGGQ